MTLAEYAGGVALVVLLAAPVVWGAVRVRRRLLPSWTGAPARLAEAILCLAVVMTVGELVGTVGSFRRYPVVVGCALVGLAMAAVGRRTAREIAAADPGPPSLLGRRGEVISLLVCAGLAGQYATRTIASLHHGVTNYDSLWYHLTFAVRFAQSGWTTRLAFVGPGFPATFHPAGTELLHGIGMLLFDRDTLTPILNLGWLALALLAAWCVGRPYGAGPLTLIGVSIVLAAPVLARDDAGSAENDLAALFFLLAAAALLLTPGSRIARTAIAGLSAGLGLSSKLSVVGLVCALTVAVILWIVRSEPRGSRARLTGAWVVGTAATGSFFYIRNWIRVGSPLPGLDLHLLGLPAPRFTLVDTYGYSVAHYAGDWNVIWHWFLPGLNFAFGSFGLLTIALLAVAVVVVVTTTREDGVVLRLLGVVAGVGAVIYALTPTTAIGRIEAPELFQENTVYLTPTLALGLGLLPLPSRMRRGHRPQVLLGVLLAVLVSTWRAGNWPAWPARYRTVGITVAFAVAVCGLLLFLHSVTGRRWPTRRWLIPALGVAALSVAYGPVAQAYERDRYAADPEWSWAAHLTHTRIAIAGFIRQYPLYGANLSNHVQYVGAKGPHGEFQNIATCSEWREKLRRGRYDYVMIEPHVDLIEGGDVTLSKKQLAWLRTDPAASGPLQAGSWGWVFRFDASIPDPGC